MIYKFIFGKPFETESVVNLPSDTQIFTDDLKQFPAGKISLESGFELSIPLADDDMIFGLGEAMGGINKRGRIYRSWCNDDPSHTEEKESLYGVHNFLVIYSPSSHKCFGLYADYPGNLVIDAGCTKKDVLSLSCGQADIVLYYIEEKNGGIKDVVSAFRNIIGTSYIPPYWAFGYMQSRWGYGSQKDVEDVLDNYRALDIPLDAIFLDIDYMDGFRDFTVDSQKIPDLKKTVSDLKENGVHLVPIIDAGVKSDEGYSVDEEGIKENMFCRKKDGSLFRAAVWPGLAHFPDFLNPDVRRWFGKQYSVLLDCGIDGFWNDMNEPALFYSEDGIKRAADTLTELAKKADRNDSIISWSMKDTVLGVQNSIEDYKSFYHRVPASLCGNFSDSEKDGTAIVRHDKVHNLYGFNMTRAAAEYFSSNCEKPVFLISRASFIGMHRYGGIWTGDNCSWWSHILLCLKMLPSLNMCGFLYTGCDLGGFSCNTTRELLLRFLALGVFTPLMRNHSALGTRAQEVYAFENPEDFRAIIQLRYRLLPYLYNEYVKACRNGTMYFRPLAFDYPDDRIALSTEDQLMLGEELMIAPVYVPNAAGRTVYLPEDMYCVRCRKENGGCAGGEPEQVLYKKGVHFIFCAADEVVFFIKKNCAVPVVLPARNSSEIDYSTLSWWGDSSAFGKYKMISD